MEIQQSSSQPQTSSLPGVGQLLSETLKIYKKKISVFLGIAVIPALFYLPIFFLQGNSEPEEYSQGGNPFFGIIFLLLGLLAAFLNIWAFPSLLFAIRDREQEIGVKELFAKGWSRIISFAWVSILVGLISMVGFFLLIIPGIIFSVWYSLSEYVLISEDLRGMAALNKSKQLVKGYWGKVFWRFMGLGFITFLVIIPVIIITGIAGFLGAFFVANIVNLIVRLFIFPFTVVYGFLIYEHLKRIKNGAVVGMSSEI